MSLISKANCLLYAQSQVSYQDIFIVIQIRIKIFLFTEEDGTNSTVWKTGVIRLYPTFLLSNLRLFTVSEICKLHSEATVKILPGLKFTFILHTEQDTDILLNTDWFENTHFHVPTMERTSNFLIKPHFLQVHTSNSFFYIFAFPESVFVNWDPRNRFPAWWNRLLGTDSRAP